MWLLIAFLAPAFYALSNVLDNFLVNQKFKNPTTLAFYTSLFNLLFLPLVFIFFKPVMPSAAVFPILFLLGFINIIYLYPYYKGLQSDDTSIAISFFSLGRIFIPILAFFIVGEVLTLFQYVGIGLLILSSTLLSLRGWKEDFRFSKAFWYIGLAAFILSFEGVLIKYLFGQGVNLGTVLVGEGGTALLLALLFLIPQRTRSDIIANVNIFRQMFPVFAAEETFTFIAFVSESYAIALASVSMAKSISMLTPFFLVFYARFLSKNLPGVFREEIDGWAIAKKALLFAIMIVGVMLIRD
ncbi:MAG: EamA family transporter [Candidatus Harrisonbacteria bacterium]|nr:EamA family transporter [Candidatus Harrisonbacteria bacterium]